MLLLLLALGKLADLRTEPAALVTTTATTSGDGCDRSINGDGNCDQSGDDIQEELDDGNAGANDDDYSNNGNSRRRNSLAEKAAKRDDPVGDELGGMGAGAGAGGEGGDFNEAGPPGMFDNGELNDGADDEPRDDDDDDDGNGSQLPSMADLLQTGSPAFLELSKKKPVAPVPDADQDRAFEQRWQRMEKQIHKTLAAMKPAPTAPNAASLLETPTGQVPAAKPAQPPPSAADEAAALAEKADELQRKLQQDVENLQPVTPSLAEPDLAPSSFLQRGEAAVSEEQAWKQRMAALSKDTSWAELASRVERTKEAADSMKASSFAEIEGRSETAQTSQTSEASMRQQLRALEKKEKTERTETLAEMDAFTAQTEADLAELQKPHTSVTAALARAKARR